MLKRIGFFEIVVMCVNVHFIYAVIVNEILSSQQVCHYRVRKFGQQEIVHGINNRKKSHKNDKKRLLFDAVLHNLKPA